MTKLQAPKLKENPKYNWVDNPLKILISARIRLTPEQRQLVKDSYYKLKQELTNPSTTNGHTGLQVQTQFTQHALDNRMGMSSMVFSDVIASRDSLSLSIVLKIQKALDITLLTEQDLRDACESYIDYVFNFKEV